MRLDVGDSGSPRAGKGLEVRQAFFENARARREDVDNQARVIGAVGEQVTVLGRPGQTEPWLLGDRHVDVAYR